MGGHTFGLPAEGGPTCLGSKTAAVSVVTRQQPPAAPAAAAVQAGRRAVGVAMEALLVWVLRATVEVVPGGGSDGGNKGLTD